MQQDVKVIWWVAAGMANCMYPMQQGLKVIWWIGTGMANFIQCSKVSRKSGGLGLAWVILTDAARFTDNLAGLGLAWVILSDAARFKGNLAGWDWHG